jgi:Transglycosylase SLT domain
MRYLITLASLVAGLTFAGAIHPDVQADGVTVSAPAHGGIAPAHGGIIAARALIHLQARRHVEPETLADRRGGAAPVKDAAADARADVSVESICTTIQAAAASTELPVEFFTRLIWQESRFDPQAVSRAGARGIAQFMPATAAFRGLADPFDPIEALRESAEYLRDLRRQFGNLGLAAAAYNAGPRRVQDWLAKRGGLPRETRSYVRIVTGREAEDWTSAEPLDLAAIRVPAVPCPEIAKALVEARARVMEMRKRAPVETEAPANWAPWGVQLAGSVSEATALAEYERLRRQFAILRDRAPIVVTTRVPGRGTVRRHLVRLAENSRVGAEKLCGQLRAAGAACIVLRNPRPVLAGS